MKGHPSSHEDGPSKAEDTPSNAEDIPSASEGTPSKLEDVPSILEDTPSGFAGTSSGPEERDVAYAAHIRNSTQKGKAAPDVEELAKINDTAFRQRTAVEAYRSWSRTDAVAARKWLDSSRTFRPNGRRGSEGFNKSYSTYKSYMS
jgi:hypothetical protein